MAGHSLRHVEQVEQAEMQAGRAHGYPSFRRLIRTSLAAMHPHCTGWCLLRCHSVLCFGAMAWGIEQARFCLKPRLIPSAEYLLALLPVTHTALFEIVCAVRRGCALPL
jgi:hypothetical protein